jgi:hypothetical protein
MNPSFSQVLGFVVVSFGVFLYRMGTKYDGRNGRKK